MNAPSAPPADWRSRYGFDQGLSPEQQAYWDLNLRNGNLGAQGVNTMPYVMNPAQTFSLDRGIVKDQVFGGGGGGQPSSGGQPSADPQIMQLIQAIQSKPELMPQIMQLLGGM